MSVGGATYSHIMDGEIDQPRQVSLSPPTSPTKGFSFASEGGKKRPFVIGVAGGTASGKVITLMTMSLCLHFVYRLQFVVRSWTHLVRMIWPLKRDMLP